MYFCKLDKVETVLRSIIYRCTDSSRATRPTSAQSEGPGGNEGTGSLINLLHQYRMLNYEKKPITCSVDGYSDVGKSSLKNTLHGKKLCRRQSIDIKHS